MPYLGNEPAAAFTSTTKDSFSGDASTTDFTMSKSANVNAVRVVVENVVQNPTVAYTCSGTTLSFTSAPPTGTNNIYVVHLGPPAATVAPPSTINNPTTFTGGVTLKNETPEDTDGGRESIVTFQGTQSGSEISTLAQIQASHDGTSDDEKADLIFKTNDGSDGASPTEAMRIDSAGRVGIGITPAAVSDSTGAPTLQLGGTFLIHFDEDGAGTTTLGNNLYYNGTANKALFAGSTSQYYQAGGTHVWRNSGSTSAGSTATLSESMRIDSSGTLLVGHTNKVSHGQPIVLQAGGSGTFFTIQRNDSLDVLEVTTKANTTTGRTQYAFQNSNGTVGTIQTSGSSTSFNTSSDYRLKENVTNVTDGITRVKQLSPKRFNFIADADTTVDGFLAHEAATVVPEAVTGIKDEVDANGDAVMQGIDQSKIVPLLTAALREAIAKIETLETKVAALEGGK